MKPSRKLQAARAEVSKLQRQLLVTRRALKALGGHDAKVQNLTLAHETAGRWLDSLADTGSLLPASPGESA